MGVVLRDSMELAARILLLGREAMVYLSEATATCFRRAPSYCLVDAGLCPVSPLPNVLWHWIFDEVFEG